MSYTFATLRAEALAYGFTSDYTSRIGVWLNEGQHRVARRIEIRDLLVTSTTTTVAGQVAYALPSDFARLRALTRTDTGTPMDPVSIEFFDGLLYSPQATGAPRMYTFDGSGLNLYPTPDGAYNLQLRYYRDPPDMALDGDTPSIPPAYQDILISYAVMKAYRAEDDVQMAQFYLGEFNRGLAELASDRQFEIDDSPRQVPGTWGNRHPFTGGMFT